VKLQNQSYADSKSKIGSHIEFFFKMEIYLFTFWIRWFGLLDKKLACILQKLTSGFFNNFSLKFTHTIWNFKYGSKPINLLHQLRKEKWLYSRSFHANTSRPNSKTWKIVCLKFIPNSNPIIFFCQISHFQTFIFKFQAKNYKFIIISNPKFS
jgi:hypothetical protein